jgi:hypothetical protein
MKRDTGNTGGARRPESPTALACQEDVEPETPQNPSRLAIGTNLAHSWKAGQTMPRFPERTMHTSIAIALMGLLGASVACAVHEPKPVFRAGVIIGERGISVPLPPPSLVDAPTQEVEVEGEVIGDEAVPEGTVVHLLESVGGEEATVELTSGAKQFVAGLRLDLTDNCLELWLETPDGRMSDEPARFHAVITEEDDVAAEQGCE